MSTTSSAPTPAKGSPMLLVLFAVVLAPAFLIGYASGAGSASVVGGFVAMYSLIAFLGGPLRGDLCLAAALSPLLPAGDPLVATALLTTFGILQASWRETLVKARPRVIGLVGGAALAVVIILVVPAPYLPVVALTALVVALWNMMSRPRWPTRSWWS